MPFEGEGPVLPRLEPSSPTFSSPSSPPPRRDEPNPSLHPQTPQSQNNQNKRPRLAHQQHARFPSLPSPSPSSMAMGLHRLGIGIGMGIDVGGAAYSPLAHNNHSHHHQLSPPPTWSSPSPSSAHHKDHDSGDDEDPSDNGVRQYDNDDDVFGPEEPEGLPELDDLTQDSRDVLVERLGDLVRHLQQGGAASVGAIDELHAKVDEMEGVLMLAAGADGSGGGSGRRRKRRRRPELSPLQRSNTSSILVMSGMFRSGNVVEVGEEQRPVSALSTPPWLGAGRFPERSVELPLPKVVVEPEEEEVRTEKVAEGDKPSDVVERVAAEAEDLNAQLLKVVQSLQERRKESNHIHALLVERAEAAAARILDLEKEVADLEDEVSGNESELRHLRIELRAVEALCHEFVSPEADPELVQSIANWKSDWARIRDKMSAKKEGRRLRHRELGDGDSDSTILTASLASPAPCI